MPGGAQLQYIHLRDFTRGIASSRHSLGGTQPSPEDPESAAVFAQQADTYGCYGLPTGGLHPLPGVIRQVRDPANDWPTGPLPGAATLIPANPAHPNYTSERSLVVNATGIIRVTVNPRDEYGEEVPPSGWRDNEPTTPDQLHILYGGYGRARESSSSVWFQGTHEWRIFNMGRNPIDAIPLKGGHLAAADNRDSLGVRLPPQTSPLAPSADYGRNFMLFGYSDASLVVATSGVRESPGGSAGPDGSAFDIGRTAMVALAGRVGIFPRIIGKNAENTFDPGRDEIETYVPGQVGTLAPLQGRSISYGIVHQGRIVFAAVPRISDQASQRMGEGARIGTGDAIGFYPANNLYSSPVVDQYRFMPENPGTIGVMVSMNANELIAIKHSGGGGLLRGDVARPQFVALPGLPSIQQAPNIPVVTNMGLIFGTSDGVYVWQGAEGAELISQQIDGWFWKPDDVPAGGRPKFNVSSHLVYAPNNWIFDQRTGGWFRLNPTRRQTGTAPNLTTRYVAYRNYEVSATGRVYGIKPIVTESDPVVAHVYDRDVPTHEFQWRSHPIPRTLSKRVDVREMVLVAQGVGTIVVTVIGLNGQRDAVTFAVNSPNQPRMYTKPIRVESEDVEVMIRSTGAGTPTFTDDGVPFAIPGSPAPSIYRLSLGIDVGPTVARVGTLVRTPRSS